MYYVSKKLEIAASHRLTTEPPTKCSRLHGHNYRVEIFCRSEELDANGMVTDFGLIKARVFDVLDHHDLNEVLPFNPTSENIARWICGQVPGCYKVSVQETSGNTAVYIKDYVPGDLQDIRELLEYIGEDPSRTGLKDTPDRMLRMFREIFRGYDPAQKPEITTFPNGSGTFYSICEHHCRTFFGEYWFAYLPNPKGRILGLSKIARAVDYCASRLQVQERLVHDVVEMLTEALGDENPPRGMALMMRGRHMCKEGRGVRKPGMMTTTCLTGAFRNNPQVRGEFLSYVGKI